MVIFTVESARAWLPPAGHLPAHLPPNRQIQGAAWSREEVLGRGGEGSRRLMWTRRVEWARASARPTPASPLTLGSASTSPFWCGSRPGPCVHKSMSRSPAPPRRFSEPVDRIQRFLPGPPSPIRPEPTTVGRRPTAPCTRAPPPCVARNGARTPTGSYMEAIGESTGVVGAARVVWEDRSCTTAPRQPSLSQTNRCLLRAPRTAARGLLCPVPSGTPCPAPAACLGASRALQC